MAFAAGEFIFMVMDAMVLEAVEHQAVVSVPTVCVAGRVAFDLAMNHS